ncbi:putative MATE family efflux protein [Methanococcus maripaludis]|uniref:Multidrug export protein MepA n=2 Tax=Methanococcus maripaludis TaxID=39152 RepID=Q6LZD0_METMP|nr:MATE family efflux transporter [Methanococcus maripaludis]MBA2850891.1 putative MATE family efflux protein [Methanococcus maripaludis]MBB6067799.1 putative MATE family efflux protein [Methanococcus maripaludis]CAF30255.1 C-5 cytosine-specific DNA methylase:Multi antimicrobial extrusion (MatE) protein [Methanococcus maripaludis S2]
MAYKSEFLGTEDVKKLLVKLSVPAIIGMLIMALYNIVDGFFIGRWVGTAAFTGIALIFPFQMMIMAFGVTFGIGGSSLLSRKLGEGNLDFARKAGGNAISSVLILSVLITIVGVVFMVPILNLLGTSADIFPYAKDYYEIILYGTIFNSYLVAANNLVRAEGMAKVAMFAMVVPAIINIILDPILIIVFNMGIKGAAIATVLSQIIGVIYILKHQFGKNTSIKYAMNDFLINLKILKETVFIGASEFAKLIISSILLILGNNLLGIYGGDIAIAIYGVIMRIAMLLLMPVLGIVQGFQPIVGYNYGKGQLNRVSESIKLALVGTSGLCLLGFILVMIFPEKFIQIFITDPEVISQGVFATRIFFMFSFLIGAQMTIGGLYQSLGKAKPAFIISCARQTLFLMPALIILPLFFGLNGIWFSFPIGDLLGFTLASGIIFKDRKSLNLSS